MTDDDTAVPPASASDTPDAASAVEATHQPSATAPTAAATDAALARLKGFLSAQPGLALAPALAALAEAIEGLQRHVGALDNAQQIRHKGFVHNTTDTLARLERTRQTDAEGLTGRFHTESTARTAGQVMLTEALKQDGQRVTDLVNAVAAQIGAERDARAALVRQVKGLRGLMVALTLAVVLLIAGIVGLVLWMAR